MPRVRCAACIDADATRASDIKREKAADHGDILPEVIELVAALCGVGDVPEAVADQSGNEREGGEQQSGVASLKADENCEAAERFGRAGNERQRIGEAAGKAVIGKVA